MAEHRVVLITGSAGGIGSATAELFRAEGWEVIAVDRAPAGRGHGLALQADLSQPADIRRIVAQVSERYDRLDALVNNAAEQLCKPLRELTVEEWDRVMACNVRAAYQLAVGLYELIRAVPGCVVNVASIHALATSRGMAAYAASKGALVALTRSMAVEFAPDGVRANAVVPGAVETPMLAAGLKRAHLAGRDPSSREALATLASQHPLGRIGKPEEVAQAIAFLADPKRSSFVTGEMLIVDGGAYAHLSTE